MQDNPSTLWLTKPTPLLLTIIALSFVLPDIAYAQTVEMPWEGILCKIAYSMTGGTARAMALIALVVTGISMMFFEMGKIVTHLLGLMMGIGIAVLANDWIGFIKPGAVSSCVGA